MTTRWLRWTMVAGMAALTMLGVASRSLAVPPATESCGVTGGGTIDDTDPETEGGAAAFGGNAGTSKDGTIGGHWHHSDLTIGVSLTGRPQYIVCRDVADDGPGQPGGTQGLEFNQVYFGGPAEWRDPSVGIWAAGYWFDVVAKDRGGLAPDTYHITVRTMDDGVVYEAVGELVGGSFQIHPSNAGHPDVPSTLPAWVSLEP